MDNIFRLMPNGDVFSAGWYVVIIIGAGRLFDMAAGINSEIIVMSKLYKFNMILLFKLLSMFLYINLYKI